MINKGIVFKLFFAVLPALAYSYSDDNQLSEKLNLLEDIIMEAELQTSSCQMDNTWHFPLYLYNYINLAKHYGENLGRGKNEKKFHEYLQELILAVDECIEGRKGYWSGNWNDVWVDPVPSVPDCALEYFKIMKAELEGQIASL